MSAAAHTGFEIVGVFFTATAVLIAIGVLCMWIEDAVRVRRERRKLPRARAVSLPSWPVVGASLRLPARGDLPAMELTMRSAAERPEASGAPVRCVLRCVRCGGENFVPMFELGKREPHMLCVDCGKRLS